MSIVSCSAAFALVENENMTCGREDFKCYTIIDAFANISSLDIELFSESFKT